MATEWIDTLTEPVLRSIAINLGVDPNDAVAIWEQETSRGKILKEHPTTSYGLVRGPLQVTDSTFKENFPGGRLDSQIDNAIAGLTYYKKWLNKTNGDKEAALQAYHSGSPGVTRKNKQGIIEFKKDPLGKMTGAYAREVLNRIAKLEKSNYDSKDYLAQRPVTELEPPSLFGTEETLANIPSLLDKEIGVEDAFQSPTFSTSGLAGDFDPQAYLVSSQFDSLLDDMYNELVSERSAYG